MSFADPLARVFRDGVRSRRRPDDAHSRRRLLRAQGRLLHRMRRPGTAVLARKQNHLQVGHPSCLSFRWSFNSSLLDNRLYYPSCT